MKAVLCIRYSTFLQGEKNIETNFKNLQICLESVARLVLVNLNGIYEIHQTFSLNLENALENVYVQM